jgi:SAM-dependent methyltransferase
VTSEEIRRARQERWATKVGSEACWFVSEPPDELARELQGRRPEAGEAALDLGCGPGSITVHLARSFSLAVGIDVALGAVTQARAGGADEPHPPVFAVAEAPRLPFRDGAFSLIFDRGVLQHVPGAEWPRYFREVTRLLAPGGRYLQYCPQRRPPPVTTKAGARALAARLLGRRPSPGDGMRRAAPPNLVVEEIRVFPFTAANGKEFDFTFGLFSRTEPGPP